MSSRHSKAVAEDASLETTVPTDLSFSPDEVSELYTTDDDRLRAERTAGRSNQVLCQSQAIEKPETDRFIVYTMAHALECKQMICALVSSKIYRNLLYLVRLASNPAGPDSLKFGPAVLGLKLGLVRLALQLVLAVNQSGLILGLTNSVLAQTPWLCTNCCTSVSV